MAKIVQKLTSIVAKTGKVFRHHKITMNETSAKRLQRMIFEARTAKKNGDCTPTYVKIAEQMVSPHHQIFNMAVYDLVKIANNSGRYKSQIVKIMREYAEAEGNPTERREIVMNKLSEIK